MLTKTIFFEFEKKGIENHILCDNNSLSIKQLWVYCREKDIAMKVGDIYVECNTEKVEVFRGSGLIYTFSPHSDTGCFTDYFFATHPHIVKDDEYTSQNAAMFFDFVRKLLLITVQIHSHSVPVDKKDRGFYTLHSVKPWKIQVKEYMGGTDFLVSHKNGRHNILCNGINKKSYQVPTAMYPLPQNRPISLLYSGNAQELGDGGELGRLLNNYVPELGRCYTNVDKIVSLLHKAKYTDKHDVRYFSGWLFGEEIHQGIHHAWLVIDGKSIIDPTIEQEGYLVKIKEDIRRGKYVDFSREILATKIKEEKKNPLPFVKRCFYGKPQGWLYIGTESNSYEGVRSYMDIIKKYPDHPSYTNINKETGVNQLNEIYYGI